MVQQSYSSYDQNLARLILYDKILRSLNSIQFLTLLSNMQKMLDTKLQLKCKLNKSCFLNLPIYRQITFIKVKSKINKNYLSSVSSLMTVKVKSKKSRDIFKTMILRILHKEDLDNWNSYTDIPLLGAQWHVGRKILAPGRSSQVDYPQYWPFVFCIQAYTCP